MAQLRQGTTIGGRDIVAEYDAHLADNTKHVSKDGTLQSGLNADQVDGYHAGNSSGQVPVSNGTVCTNLNADKVDGLDVTGSGTAGLRRIYISTSSPSGGADGDVWLMYA